MSTGRHAAHDLPEDDDLAEIEAAVHRARALGYNEGHQIGYDAGYEAGREDPADVAGITDTAYQEGYQAGINQKQPLTWYGNLGLSSSTALIVATVTLYLVEGRWPW